MQEQEQLKLQSYLDGELSESEAREVAGWLARDREAVALLSELKNTRQALAESKLEIAITLPESRDFYWSKIRREIERLEDIEQQEPAPAPSLIQRLSRWLVPAGALAGLIIAAMLALQPGAPAQRVGETALADAGAFTYHDYDNGATLVWLSYPADNEQASSDESSVVN
jgi:anti-sigma factor RsiW